jgi:hypothetical protein
VSKPEGENKLGLELLVGVALGGIVSWAIAHAYYRRSSTEFSEWANVVTQQITREMRALIDGTTREERKRHASSLIDSLEVLFAKSAPGGHQIDIIARVFESDSLLAEKVFTNISAANAVGSPVKFKNLRVEIVAHPVGGGASRQAKISI